MPTVYDRRAILTRLLRREFCETDAVVVPNPDHPLLIRGPDIIISNKSNLFALFTPSAEERRFPSRLKSRFVLGRLALPSHTRCLLIFEPSDLAVTQYFSNDFADIIEWSRR